MSATKRMEDWRKFLISGMSERFMNLIKSVYRDEMYEIRAS